MPGKHAKKQFHLIVEVRYREAVLKGCRLPRLPCYLGNAQNKEE